MRAPFFKVMMICTTTLIVIVVYIWTEKGNEHYSHIVIDILKGTCEIMDPHADAQMDCIYSEVCNCMSSGIADIV